MRTFIDLHLCPLTNNRVHVEALVHTASELGYQSVGIPFPANAPQNAIHMVQDLCTEVNLDLVTRLDLSPRTPGDLLRNLRHYRRKFEVISVLCSTKPVARQAAKDRRVDLISFPSTPQKRFFDSAEAELASNALTSLEIEISPLLSFTGFFRTTLLSSLRGEVKLANKFNIPIILSSGASNEYLLRAPRDFVALTTLFDLPAPLGLHALSENPVHIVERNREKLSHNYVSPGVRIIRSGEVC